jgi:hypothetical protein
LAETFSSVGRPISPNAEGTRQPIRQGLLLIEHFGDGTPDRLGARDPLAAAE